MAHGGGGVPSLVLMEGWPSEALNWSCDLRANERPRKKITWKGDKQIYIYIDWHRDSMKASAQRADALKIICDMWNLICDTWHMTWETWLVTCGGGWTFSQEFSSLAQSAKLQTVVHVYEQLGWRCGSSNLTLHIWYCICIMTRVGIYSEI